jgi:hypothetical protein
MQTIATCEQHNGTRDNAFIVWSTAESNVSEAVSLPSDASFCSAGIFLVGFCFYSSDL